MSKRESFITKKRNRRPFRPDEDEKLKSLVEQYVTSKLLYKFTIPLSETKPLSRKISNCASSLSMCHPRSIPTIATANSSNISSMLSHICVNDINWTEIAKCMGDRTVRQCRERWTNSLCETIKKTQWSTEEDQLIMTKYNEFGPQWKLMEKFFPGRVQYDIRNRFTSLMKSRNRTIVNSLCSNNNYLKFTQQQSEMPRMQISPIIPMRQAPLFNPLKFTTTQHQSLSTEQKAPSIEKPIEQSQPETHDSDSIHDPNWLISSPIGDDDYFAYDDHLFDFM